MKMFSYIKTLNTAYIFQASAHTLYCNCTLCLYSRYAKPGCSTTSAFTEKSARLNIFQCFKYVLRCM